MRAMFLMFLTLFSAPALADTPTHITASMVIKVAQRDAAADALIAEAQRLGGYFASLSTGAVSLRVPVDKVDEVIAFAATQGLVVDRQYNSQELAAELGELNAKLATREKMLDQYFALLPQAKANSVLTVEYEIVQLVSQIEGLKGRIRLLESQATWAQLDVSFQFRERTAPVRDGSSSFAWLNSLNLADLVESFRSGWVDSRGPNPGVPELAPAGFSPYKGRHERRSVSPDEVLFRVRAVRHKPQAELGFWREATKERMLAAGYRVMDEQDIEADGVKGFALTLSAPMGNQDYSYLVAVFPVGRKLIIVEAAGEITRYEARKAEIMAAVTGMEL